MNNILEALNGNFDNLEGIELPDYNNNISLNKLNDLVTALKDCLPSNGPAMKTSELYFKLDQSNSGTAETENMFELLNEINNNVLGLTHQN